MTSLFSVVSPPAAPGDAAAVPGGTLPPALPPPQSARRLIPVCCRSSPSTPRGSPIDQRQSLLSSSSTLRLPPAVCSAACSAAAGLSYLISDAFQSAYIGQSGYCAAKSSAKSTVLSLCHAGFSHDLGSQRPHNLGMPTPIITAASAISSPLASLLTHVAPTCVRSDHPPAPAAAHSTNGSPGPFSLRSVGPKTLLPSAVASFPLQRCFSAPSLVVESIVPGSSRCYPAPVLVKSEIAGPSPESIVSTDQQTVFIVQTPINPSTAITANSALTLPLVISISGGSTLEPLFNEVPPTSVSYGPSLIDTSTNSRPQILATKHPCQRDKTQRFTTTECGFIKAMMSGISDPAVCEPVLTLSQILASNPPIQCPISRVETLVTDHETVVTVSPNKLTHNMLQHTELAHDGDNRETSERPNTGKDPKSFEADHPEVAPVTSSVATGPAYGDASGCTATTTLTDGTGLASSSSTSVEDGNLHYPDRHAAPTADLGSATDKVLGSNSAGTASHFQSNLDEGCQMQQRLQGPLAATTAGFLVTLEKPEPSVDLPGGNASYQPPSVFLPLAESCVIGLHLPDGVGNFDALGPCAARLQPSIPRARSDPETGTAQSCLTFATPRHGDEQHKSSRAALVSSSSSPPAGKEGGSKIGSYDDRHRSRLPSSAVNIGSNPLTASGSDSPVAAVHQAGSSSLPAAGGATAIMTAPATTTPCVNQNNQNSVRIVYPNGDVYEGNICGRTRHGWGKYWYLGMSLHSVANQSATALSPFVPTYEGKWHNGHKQGAGSFQESAFRCLAGNWANDRLHGFCATVDKHSRFVGWFENGARSGFGKLTTPKRSVVGTFRGNKPGNMVMAFDHRRSTVFSERYDEDGNRIGRINLDDFLPVISLESAAIPPRQSWGIDNLGVERFGSRPKEHPRGMSMLRSLSPTRSTCTRPYCGGEIPQACPVLGSRNSLGLGGSDRSRASLSVCHQDEAAEVVRSLTSRDIPLPNGTSQVTAVGEPKCPQGHRQSASFIHQGENGINNGLVCAMDQPLRENGRCPSSTRFMSFGGEHLTTRDSLTSSQTRAERASAFYVDKGIVTWSREQVHIMCRLMGIHEVMNPIIERHKLDGQAILSLMQLAASGRDPDDTRLSVDCMMEELDIGDESLAWYCLTCWSELVRIECSRKEKLFTRLFPLKSALEIILEIGSDLLFPEEDLIFQQTLGDGGFGKVKLVVSKELHISMAAKRLRRDVFGGSQDVITYHQLRMVREFSNELNLLAQLRHPNITQLWGLAVEQNAAWILTEYVPDGSLLDLLHRRKVKLTYLQILSIAIDVSAAMRYLHSEKILHCDLKSSNILLKKAADDLYTAKVCDFGLARSMNWANSFQGHKGELDGLLSLHDPTFDVGQEVGTPHWMAPEVLRGNPHTRKSDVYAFGLLLWEMMFNKVPFISLNVNCITAAVGFGKMQVKCPNRNLKSLVDIFEACAAHDPVARPSFHELHAQLRALYENELGRLRKRGSIFRGSLTISLSHHQAAHPEGDSTTKTGKPTALKRARSTFAGLIPAWFMSRLNINRRPPNDSSASSLLKRVSGGRGGLFGGWLPIE